LLAHDQMRLPSQDMMHHLTGAVLFDPAFNESL
jgi:hypothetical protein